jgi:FAD/FMN-containing dehydrogenase
MACRPPRYSGDDKTNAPRTNWNGDVLFDPTLWRFPKPGRERRRPARAKALHLVDQHSGLASLVEAVADATDTGQFVHAIGSGWAFEDCAKSDDVMVRLTNLNHELHDVLNVDNGALTDHWIGVQNAGRGPTRLVHFEAGIRVLDLCEQLDAHGFALPTLGGSNGQALAGVISTSTHGGDWQQPPFPDLVRAVHLVTVGGQEVWIESETNPLTRSDAALLDVLPCPETKVVRDDRVFDAVRVACGRFGVIYSFVLEVTRQFRVVQIVSTPDSTSVLRALRRGQTAPSPFGALFTLLARDPVPTALDDAQGEPSFLQVLFNSQRPTDVWVTRRWVTHADHRSRPDRLEDDYTSKEDTARQIVALVHAALVGQPVVVGTETAVLTALLGPAGTALGLTLGAAATTALVDVATTLDLLLASGNATFGSVVAAALSAAWKVPGLNPLIAQIQGMVLEGGIRGPKWQGGMRGPHYRVTTGSRADSDQNDFRVESIELVFDATTPNYLDFLEEILLVAPLFQQAGYVSLRPSRRSSALLSMHHIDGEFAMSIEIASLKNLPGNAPWMAYLHQAAVRYAGRPHWGQYNKLDPLTVATLYGDALSDWREALYSVSGASRQFSNEFTLNRGLEPQGIERRVTSVKRRGGKITHLCNDGEYWSPVPVGTARQEIRSGTVHYVTARNGRVAAIRVVRNGRGGFYLRSVADRTAADNLDRLPLSTLA